MKQVVYKTSVYRKINTQNYKNHKNKQNFTNKNLDTTIRQTLKKKLLKYGNCKIGVKYVKSF